MLKIGSKREAVRIVLQEASGKAPEAFLLLAPISAAMRRRALRVARPQIGEAEATAALDFDQLVDIGETLSRELIRLGVIAWGGIGDVAGKPLELTPDSATRFATVADPERPTGTIDLFLDDEDLLAIIDAQYIRPDAIRRAEKNGLSALPDGIGKAATPGKDIARSAARRKPRAAAKNAPTAKTSSKAKPPRKSGRS